VQKTQANETGVEARVGELLTGKSLTLALGESCTGGLVAHRVTNVPGSSGYFLGGLVAYANEAKQRLLHVHQDTLYNYGAVSPETAVEMARGARHALEADIGVSVTGIAGPGGGTEDKPVGLVYIGLSSEMGERCERFVWNSDRAGNKALSAETALELLRRFLEEMP
jgi:nicotinamide-nucleotide amidase